MRVTRRPGQSGNPWGRIVPAKGEGASASPDHRHFPPRPNTNAGLRTGPLAVAMLALVLAGCAGRLPAPVDTRVDEVPARKAALESPASAPDVASSTSGASRSLDPPPVPPPVSRTSPHPAHRQRRICRRNRAKSPPRGWLRSTRRSWNCSTTPTGRGRGRPGTRPADRAPGCGAVAPPGLRAGWTSRKRSRRSRTVSRRETRISRRRLAGHREGHRRAIRRAGAPPGSRSEAGGDGRGVPAGRKRRRCVETRLEALVRSRATVAGWSSRSSSGSEGRRFKPASRPTFHGAFRGACSGGRRTRSGRSTRTVTMSCCNRRAAGRHRSADAADGDRGRGFALEHAAACRSSRVRMRPLWPMNRLARLLRGLVNSTSKVMMIDQGRLDLAEDQLAAKSNSLAAGAPSDPRISRRRIAVPFGRNPSGIAPTRADIACRIRGDGALDRSEVHRPWRPPAR